VSKKVLIIEDEPDQIEMLRMRLESKGFIALSAADGEEGLDKAFREKPDLILLDIIMPNMDGFQVLQCLKEDERTKNIPIAILTASSTKDVDSRCFDCGAAKVIKKPYDSGELVGMIKKIMEA